MFASGTHHQLKHSVASIGASVALFEIGPLQEIRLVTANHLYAEVTGVSVSDMVGARINQFFPRYLESKIAVDVVLCVEDQLPAESEYVVDREGQIRWWRFIFSPVFSPEGRAQRILNTCVEITEKKQLELALSTIHHRFEAVVESAYDGIVTIDQNRIITQVNQAALDIFGYQKDDLYGKPIERLLPQKYRAKHKSYVTTFAASPVRSRPMHARSPVRGLRKDGSEFPAEVTISKIQVDHAMEMTAVVRDISERSRLIDELQKAAIEDSLTGVYNRRHLERIINRELLRCERFGCVLSLILFDIDEFKQINDNFGHAAGDLVLQALTVQVMENIREVDVFGRWGGDEFLVILPQTDIENALVWAEKIRQLLPAVSVPHDGQSISFSCSFGVTGRPHAKTSVSDLVAQADAALYQAKQAGRNCVRQNC